MTGKGKGEENKGRKGGSGSVVCTTYKDKFGSNYLLVLMPNFTQISYLITVLNVSFSKADAWEGGRIEDVVSSPMIYNMLIQCKFKKRGN